MTAAHLRVQPAATGSILDVRVTPRSPPTRVLGVRDGVLCIAVNAAPEKGKANHALLRFLARLLGVSRNAMDLRGGATSRRKRIAVAGLAPEEVRARLGPHCG